MTDEDTATQVQLRCNDGATPTVLARLVDHGLALHRRLAYTAGAWQHAEGWSISDPQTGRHVASARTPALARECALVRLERIADDYDTSVERLLVAVRERIAAEQASDH